MNFTTLQYVLIQFGYNFIGTKTYNIPELIIDNSVIRTLDIDQSQYTKAQVIVFPPEIEIGQSLGTTKYIFFGSVEDGIDVFNIYPKRIPSTAIEFRSMVWGSTVFQPVWSRRDPDDMSFALMNFICDSNDRFRGLGIMTQSGLQETSLVSGNILHRSINNVEYVQASYDATEFTWGNPAPIQTGVGNVEYVVDALNDAISLNMNHSLQNTIASVFDTAINTHISNGNWADISAADILSNITSGPVDQSGNDISQEINDELPPLEDIFQPVQVRMNRESYKQQCGVKDKKGRLKWRKMGKKLMMDMILRDSTCVFCASVIERWSKVGITPCKHVFHKSCLGTWLLKSCTKPTCPTCRHDVRDPVS